MKKSGLRVTLALLSFAVGGLAQAAPTLWVGDSAGNLGQVDVASGSVAVVGNMGRTMTDIAFDADGNLYGITFNGLYRIDRDTAASTLVGNFLPSLNALVFGADGALYAAGSSLFTIDVTTGAASPVGGSGSYNSSGDLAFVDGRLYLSSAPGDRLFQVDTTTGAGTLVGEIGFGAVYGLATADHEVLYGVSGTRILSIDAATGAGSIVLDYGGRGLYGAWGSAFVAEAIPEPETYALMGMGIGALVLARRFGKPA